MVRDLEKLRTRSEFRLRSGHLVLIIAATAAAVGLLFVVGSAFAGRHDGEAARKAAPRDPFAGLDQHAAPAATRTASAADPATSVTAVPDPEALAPVQLSFQERLAQPPAGAAPLPAPAPVDPPASAAPGGSSLDRPLSADVPAAPRPGPAPAPAVPPTLAVLPPPAAPRPVVATAPPAAPAVAVAPAPVQSMREPMAAPLPPGDPQPVFDEEATPSLAQAGEHGVFTLQVSSFDDQTEAVAFMNMLRQRGHDSFLVRANCGERGVVYRVRVGPFESQADAERYRRKFERAERIPTFVVRRTLPTSG